MFGDDAEIKKLRDDWSSMSYDDKVDRFLWKMVWYHHTKHVPGAPPHEAINRLADVLENASTVSDKLSRSIRAATWIGGLAAAAGVGIAIVNLLLKA